MEYTLTKTNDQTFWISVGNGTVNVRLYEFRGLMYVDVSRGFERIITGHRVIPNAWLLPYASLGGNGNFRLETRRPDACEYPSYKDFNTKFVFCYYTQEEIESM